MVKQLTKSLWTSVLHRLGGGLVVLCVLANAGCAAGQSRLDRLS